MRSFFLLHRNIILGFFVAILAIVSMFISNRSITNFVWTLVLWIAASVCIFYIRRDLPQKPRMGWKSEAIFIGLCGLFTIGAWVIERRDISIIPNTNYPTFQSLNETKGVLKKGIGGIIYLTKSDGNTLRLMCAAKGQSIGRRGGPPDNWCLYGKDEPYINKVVTVLHSPPFKVSSMRARFYEIRSGNDILISYEETIALKKSIARKVARYDPTFPALLTIFWLYYVFETWIVKTRSRKNT